MNKKAILVFGVGELQKSIIERAHEQGLFVVGIDPCADAYCKKDVDAFEIVDGQDFYGTLEVAKKYNISAVVTAATDKPLVMMAKVAASMKLPFYSVETAQWATDKFQMKQRFIQCGVPCAKGSLIKSIDEVTDFMFPVIIKPRDNSGSRGVKLCRTRDELQNCMNEAFEYSRLDSVLVEEFIDGQEYSIESLHYRGKTEIIQFTEKRTTEFPYNVELGHKQPAKICEYEQEEIRKIISKVATAMHFENCASHTELKINKRGIFVIETSPRLGGDYITSKLVPLSTGINIEDQLLKISLNEDIDIKTGIANKASAVCFFCLPEGKIKKIDERINRVKDWDNIDLFDFRLSEGDLVNKITSSLNRYGQFIIYADSRDKLDVLYDTYSDKINELICVDEI